MAKIEVSLEELICLLKQNAEMPLELTGIFADNNEIAATMDIPIAGRRQFVATYKSFSNGWLTLEITGKDLADKLLIGLLVSSLTVIKIFKHKVMENKFFRISGQTVFIDIGYALKDVKGLQVDDIQIQDGGMIVNISIKNVDDNLGTNKVIVAGK
jgi:hypothetical protein